MAKAVEQIIQTRTTVGDDRDVLAQEPTIAEGDAAAPVDAHHVLIVLAHFYYTTSLVPLLG